MLCRWTIGPPFFYFDREISTSAILGGQLGGPLSRAMTTCGVWIQDGGMRSGASAEFTIDSRLASDASVIRRYVDSFVPHALRYQWFV
jgi:hypothetical protein